MYERGIAMKKVFVHRYKWSHSKKRKVFRRAFKDGEVTRETVHEGWVYGVPETFTKKY